MVTANALGRRWQRPANTALFVMCVAAIALPVALSGAESLAGAPLALQGTGRPALDHAVAQLHETAMELRATAKSAHKRCEQSRHDGRPCSPALQGAIAQVDSVAKGMDDVAERMISRLEAFPAVQSVADARCCAAGSQAECCERSRAEAIALTGFQRMFVEPAFEQLQQSREAAHRELARQKALHQAATAKLPPPQPIANRVAPLPDKPPVVVVDDRQVQAPQLPPEPTAEQANACRAGQADVCFGMGQAHAARHQYGKAKDLFAKACDMAHAKACVQAGVVAQSALAGGNRKLAANVALQFFERGCKLKLGAGCVQAAGLVDKIPGAGRRAALLRLAGCEFGQCGACKDLTGLAGRELTAEQRVQVAERAGKCREAP